MVNCMYGEIIILLNFFKILRHCYTWPLTLLVHKSVLYIQHILITSIICCLFGSISFGHGLRFCCNVCNMYYIFMWSNYIISCRASYRTTTSLLTPFSFAVNSVSSSTVIDSNITTSCSDTNSATRTHLDLQPAYFSSGLPSRFRNQSTQRTRRRLRAGRFPGRVQHFH